MNWVKEFSVSSIGKGPEKTSLRCWGRRPSRPPEEPFLNDLTALSTSAGETQPAVGVNAGKTRLSTEIFGWMEHNLSRVAGELSAGPSGEQTSLTPEDRFPCSIQDDSVDPPIGVAAGSEILKMWKPTRAERNDIVWLMNGSDGTSTESRLEWVELENHMLDVSSGLEPYTTTRLTIFLVDEVKKIEELRIKKPHEGLKFVVQITLSMERPNLDLFFPQKEEASIWASAIKRAKISGENCRKKFEKHQKTLEKKNGLKFGAKNPVGDEYGEVGGADVNAVDNVTGFEVEVDSTAAAIRNDVVGCGCVLLLTKQHVTLHQREKKVIISWKYQHVRRFGYSQTTFTLEGGTRSGVKGQGLFIFRKCMGKLIRKTIEQRIKVLTSQLNSCSTSSLDKLGDYLEEGDLDNIYSGVNVHKMTDQISNASDEVLRSDDYEHNLHCYDLPCTVNITAKSPTSPTTTTKCPLLPNKRSYMHLNSTVNEASQSKNESFEALAKSLKEQRLNETAMDDDTNSYSIDIIPRPKILPKKVSKQTKSVSENVDNSSSTLRKNLPDCAMNPPPKKPPRTADPKMSDIVKMLSSDKKESPATKPGFNQSNEAFYSSLNFLPDVAQQTVDIKGTNPNGPSHDLSNFLESGNIYGEAMLKREVKQAIVQQICTDDALYAEANSKDRIKNNFPKGKLFKKK
ncbi:hypothetical protein HELRODRAFT_181677 [Helobdella robusta]|uniref:IRS-type PTB domain-containing protein n=1 Tax=Helobdella robusta TaxID=6412 RepID=T1FH81_HELRO|nr:hypothetical protein HELRODRAFT_181677 [Helobdella robusta]ESN92207.1 hypothetical protein HELRODRAFT_181677 [Helobdella robusta]